MKRYFRVWFMVSYLSITVSLTQKKSSLFFLFGKAIRFIFFYYFLSFISAKVHQISGYSQRQLIEFYLFYTFLDSCGQTFFRGIYLFRNQIIHGEFDYRLLKPMNPLFRTLTQETDILDIPLFIVTVVWLAFYVVQSPVNQIISFIVLTVSSLTIVVSAHIIIAALGIITYEVENLMWLYRDLSGMTRVPIDIYSLPIQTILTYIVPIGLAFSFPIKILESTLPTYWIFLSPLISCILFYLSIRLWNYSLRWYTSAAS